MIFLPAWNPGALAVSARNRGRHGNYEPLTAPARLPAYVTIGAVIAAPWLLAAVEDWAALLIAVPVLAGGGIWCLVALRRTKPLPIELRLAGAAAVLLLGFLVFQVIPLSDGMLQAISPEAARIRMTARDVLMGVCGRGVVLPRVSLAPRDTMRVIVSFLTGWICFSVGLETRRSTVSMIRTLRLVVFSSVLLVLVALVQVLGESDRIFSFYEPRLGGHVMGAFTNRNHFASYVNMALGVGLGLLGMSRMRRNAETAATYAAGRLAQPSAVFLAVIVLILGTLASLSRGGLMGLVTCAAIFWILAPRAARPWRLAGTVGPALLLGLALGLWIAGGRMVERFVWLHERVADINGMIRWAAIKDAWRLFAAFPVTGCGAGAFQHTFPCFASAPVLIGRWTHLHNDFVEWLCEGGLAGIALSGGIGIALLALAVRGWKALMQGERWLAAGMAAALGGLAVHSAVDYNLHRMTHWLLASLLLGMLSGLVLRARMRRVEDRARRVSVSSRLEGVVRGMGIAALMVLLWFAVSELMAEGARARVWQLTESRRDYRAGWEKKWAAEAVIRDLGFLRSGGAGTADLLLDMEWCALQWIGEEDIEPRKRIALGELARELGAAAVLRAPANYECWLWLSRSQRVAGSLVLAGRYLDIARELAPESLVLIE